jgi:hypothetical protein
MNALIRHCGRLPCWVHLLLMVAHNSSLLSSFAARPLGPLQVKILREAEGGKLDANGKPRSKGMGFVEFR